MSVLSLVKCLGPSNVVYGVSNLYPPPLHPAERVFFALDEDKVCRATALLLLQNAVKFNLREFQDVWQQSVPEGMGTRLDQLKVRLCH